MLNLSLWFHAGRARTPGQPNHTELISLLLIQGVSEFDWGAAGPAAATAASAAAARQTTPAAGASEG
jgi:hypothetical protein